MKTPLTLWMLVLAAAPLFAEDGFTVPARRGRCHEEIQTQGELRAAATVNIHAPEMEESYLTVKRVLDNGVPVKKGDVVIEFDDTLYQLALKVAGQEVDLKKAQRDQTRFQLDDERIKDEMEVRRREIALAKAETEVVHDATIVSRVEHAKSLLSVQLAQVELAQARKTREEFGQKAAISLKVKDLEVAEAQRKVDDATEALKKIVVRAPRDGVIYKPFVRLNNEKGRVERNKVVRPGDKLLEIPSFEGFEGACYLCSADVRLVKPGDPVAVRLTIKPDAPFRARVLRKDPYPMTRNERLGRDDPEGHLKEFEVVLGIEDHDLLFRSGLTFTASIDTTLATDALFVPQAAVHATDPAHAFVYTPGSTGPVKTPVVLGPAGFSYAVIQSGLSEGQPVLLGVGW